MNRAETWILAAAAALLMGIVPARALAEGGRAASPSQGSGHGGRFAEVPLEGVCNLNTADQGQLELLPGIGPAKAKAILAFRQKQPFRLVEELVKVKGIGRKTFARLRTHLTVSGGTTLTRTRPPTP